MTDFAVYSRRRGFARFDADQRVEIARRGGKAIPREKRAFSQNPELARRAGQAGGRRRREANSGDAALLRKMQFAPLELKLPLSGRMTARIARLLKLQYIREVSAGRLYQRRFTISQLGRDFLLGREETPSQAD